MKRIIPLFFISFIYLMNGFSQSFDWAYNIHGNSFDMAGDILVDASGNVFSTGSFSATVDFDPGPGVNNLSTSSSSNKYGAFLTKTDSSGNFIWARAFGAQGGSAVGISIFIDIYGNILTTGLFRDTIDADPGPGVFNLIGGFLDDVYIIKLDSNGNFLWARSIGGPQHDFSNGISCDATGNVYVCGTFDDTLDFDPGPGVFQLVGSPFASVYLLKLESNGNFLWAFTLGGSSRARAILNDQGGNVIIVGGFSSGDFDPGPGIINLNSSYGYGYLSKYDSSGNFISLKQIGGEVYSVKKDLFSNILLTGVYQNTLDFDPGPGIYNLTSYGSNEIFILKLDSIGNFNWAHSFGSPGLDRGNSISTDNFGNVYSTGHFSNTVDFDPGPGQYNLASANWPGGEYILKLTPDGNFVSAKKIVPLFEPYTCSMQSDPFGNIYLMGTFFDNIDFDPGQGYYFLNPINLLNPGTSADAFILKLKHDSCANLMLGIDSVFDVSCSQQGFAIAVASNGIPPYNYLWNTIPPDTDSLLTVGNSGIYSVTIIDSIGCTRTSSVLINHPFFPTQFDLNVNLIATAFVPGRSSNLIIDGFNDGCIPVTGNIELVLDSNVNYLYASPPPGLITGDTLIWSFGNLYYNSAHIQPQVFVSTDTSVLAGTSLCFFVRISPLYTDADSSNNQKQFCYNTQSSIDPNDKKVFPKGSCNDNYILKDELLTYTIRFQNTGDTTAFNVIILDTLNPDLNLNTCRVIGKSHPLITEILPGNILKFRFDNINLPDSNSNEPASHGYVIYEIFPDSGTADGTLIENHADILFDYNGPVKTNTVKNTLIGTIPYPDITVIQNAQTLTATATGASYQWIDCLNNFLLLNGDTNQSYTASANGSFAVIINLDGCIDTSGCITIIGAGFSDPLKKHAYSIYPNPALSTLFIKNFDSKIKNIVIYNARGEKVKSYKGMKFITIDDLSTGLYLVQLYDKNGIIHTEKVVVLD